MAVLELVPRVMIDDVREEQLKLFGVERKTRNISHDSVVKDLTSTKVSKHM